MRLPDHPRALAPVRRLGTRFMVGAWVLVMMGELSACRPCDTFDERMCERLGARDCALWRGDLRKAGSPSMHEATPGASRNRVKGRLLVERLLYGENGRICGNALDNFEPIAQGIEAVVHAHKMHHER